MAEYTYRIDKVSDGKAQIMYLRDGYPDIRGSVKLVGINNEAQLTAAIEALAPTARWDAIDVVNARKAGGYDAATAVGKSFTGTTP